MSFSIRLTADEKSLAESYAKLHSISLGEAFKRALFERIEDEYDIAIADAAYREYLADPKTYTHEEARELLEFFLLGNAISLRIGERRCKPTKTYVQICGKSMIKPHKRKGKCI